MLIHNVSYWGGGRGGGGGVTYRLSYAKRHNDAEGWWPTITNDVLKLRPIIEFESS